MIAHAAQRHARHAGRGVAVEDLQRVRARSRRDAPHSVDANWLHASATVGGATSTPESVDGGVILASRRCRTPPARTCRPPTATINEANELRSHAHLPVRSIDTEAVSARQRFPQGRRSRRAPSPANSTSRSGHAQTCTRMTTWRLSPRRCWSSFSVASACARNDAAARRPPAGAVIRIAHPGVTPFIRNVVVDPDPPRMPIARSTPAATPTSCSRSSRSRPGSAWARSARAAATRPSWSRARSASAAASSPRTTASCWSASPPSRGRDRLQRRGDAQRRPRRSRVRRSVPARGARPRRRLRRALLSRHRVDGRRPRPHEPRRVRARCARAASTSSSITRRARAAAPLTPRRCTGSMRRSSSPRSSAPASSCTPSGTSCATRPTSATGTRRRARPGERRGTSDRFALQFVKPARNFSPGPGG